MLLYKCFQPIVLSFKSTLFGSASLRNFRERWSKFQSKSFASLTDWKKKTFFELDTLTKVLLTPVKEKQSNRKKQTIQ